MVRSMIRSRGGQHTTSLASAALVVLVTACMPPAPPSTGGSASQIDAPRAMTLVPPGYGSLRQEEISITLQAESEGQVQIRVTPLAESVTRLAAPDSWERLSGLRARMSPDTIGGEVVFLVSFYTEEIGATFGPEDLVLSARGRRLRPIRIQPISPTWGQGRLPQREPLSALYQFDMEEEILSEDFDVEYRMSRSGAWRSILLRLQAERAKVRARAGG